MLTWKQFLLEKQEHEFSSTQVNLPETLAAQICQWNHDLIPNSDLYINGDDYGREDEFHVTVLFGLHANNADGVKKVLLGEKPIKLTLGSTSIFEGDKYDVVKVSVESNDLCRLNKILRKSCEHTQTHPKYIPHCTLAYVKRGLGKKYVGDDKFAGTKVEIDEVLFSNKRREKTRIALQ